MEPSQAEMNDRLSFKLFMQSTQPDAEGKRACLIVKEELPAKRC